MEQGSPWSQNTALQENYEALKNKALIFFDSCRKQMELWQKENGEQQ